MTLDIIESIVGVMPTDTILDMMEEAIKEYKLDKSEKNMDSIESIIVMLGMKMKIKLEKSIKERKKKITDKQLETKN